jgi:hypothetical protein
MSLALPERNSAQSGLSVYLAARQSCDGVDERTWRSVNWFWHPVRVRVVVERVVALVERLDTALVVAHQFAVVIIDQRRNDAADRVGSFPFRQVGMPVSAG